MTSELPSRRSAPSISSIATSLTSTSMLQGKPKRGEGDAKEEKNERKRSSQPFLFSQAAKEKTAVPEKASATLAEQQLAALLKEAQGFQAETGYENQIKAAFYYQVAFAFCEKKVKELAEVAKKEEKKSVVGEVKTEVAALDLSSVTKILSKDFSVFYTIEKEKIIQALVDLEQAYPEKSLCLSLKVMFGSATALKESKTPVTPLPSREVILKHLINNPHKTELQRIRTKAASRLDAYKKQLTVVTTETKSESKSILTMQGIYRELTADMKQLVRQMITDCIKEYSSLLGYPPCDYAFFGLGSMARDEMTPYSDLEFGILIAEDDIAGINKTYFQHITKFLHLKIINLGETIPRIMDPQLKLPLIKITTAEKPEWEEVPNPVPNGLSFDGVGPGGCKNPFGRKDKFELIGTPEALADYQDQKHYEDKGNLQDERFLPSSLARVTLIVGGKAQQPLLATPIEAPAAEDEALLKRYLAAVHQHLDQPTENLWGKPLTKSTFTRRQARALELLLSDLERFSPKMGKVEADGRSYSVKHDFYRLPNTLLDQIALYYGLEARSLWDQIGMLAKPTADDSSPLLSKEAAIHLQRAIDSISYHRLSAYLHLREQSEEAYLQDDQGVVQTYGQNYQRHYALPQTDAFAIYYCLIPLWQAVKRFRDSAGDKRAFQTASLGLYSESSLVKGKIKQLLQGHYQALPDFENAVKTAKQSAEAFTASLKTPAEAVKENKNGKGTLENKSASPSGNPSKELADALYVLGTTQFELRQYAVAESNLKAALKIFQAFGHDAIAETSACLLSLILALKPQGKTRATEANTYLAEATDLITYHYGKRHPYFARVEVIKGDLETVFHHTATDWHIPPSNDESFVGREALLKKLADHFVAMEVGQRLVLSAVSGLGGVGKTTLAIQYLHHPKHPYELRVWFRAENATTLLADYQDFAIAKGLVLRGEKTDPKALIHLVKTHLEKHTGWLAIYDNVENYDEIQSYLPVKGGHVILSTRRHEWPQFWSKERTAGWHTMEVDVFTLEEALSYLKKFTGRGPDEEASMKLLAEALGRLPLALAQAAAYIKRRVVTVADYLNRYQQRKRELLADKLLPANSESLPVASTWDVSVTHILDEEGMAATPERSISWNILQAISYLHSEEIPCALLERWLQEAGFAKDDVEVKQKLEAALTHLHDYSLIQRSPDRQTVSLHRLVQEVMRGRFGVALHKKPAEEKGETKSETSSSPALLETKAVIPTTPEDKAKAAEAKEIAEALSKNKEGRTQSKNGRLVEAESSLRESMIIFKCYDKSYAIDLGKCYLDLALVLAQQLKKEQAQEYVAEAHKLFVAQYGAAHPLVARCEHVRHYIKSPLATGRRELKRWPSADVSASSSFVFIGREKYLAQLTKSVDLTLVYEKAPRTVLIGLEGMGKTALARQYWHSADYAYDLRVWFQADDAITLLREYRNFAKELGLFSREAKGEPSESEVIYAVKSYLESYPDWLIVYDNAGSYQALKLFLPNQGGHVVITTCRREWQEVATRIEVVAMEEIEALAYLNELTKDKKEVCEPALLSGLVKSVGCLPLALYELVMILKKEPLRLSGYDKLSVTQELLKKIAAIWHKQFESIQQEEKQAGHKSLSLPILRQIAEINRENKSSPIVIRMKLENWLQEQKMSKDAAEAKSDLDKALGHLHDYSLIYLHPEDGTIAVHCLVQEVSRLLPTATVLESGEQKEVKGKMSEATPAKVPRILATLADSINDEFYQKMDLAPDEKLQIGLLSHLQALVKHFEELSITPKPLSLGSLLFKVGKVFLGQIADPQQAKACYEQVLMINETHYGRDHWEVANTLGNLAIAHGDLGNDRTKKMLLERALAILEAHHGREHWLVAKALVNLANVHRALGDAPTAKALLERALVIFEAYYGRDHWQVAATLVNLSSVYGDLGDPRTQKALLERVLVIFETYYGREHWQVAATLVNLGSAHGDLGDARTQKALLERALTIQEAYYGQDHWQVASTLANLGTAYGALGNVRTKKLLLERALAIEEAHYGRDHWQAAMTLVNLGSAHGELGDARTQKALQERALAIQEAHYGRDHWQVTATLGSLACAHGELGDARTKKLLLERALVIQEKHYVRDHWQVAMTLGNLANAHEALGDSQKAKSLLQRALVIEEAHYGRNHWQVAMTLGNLANVHDTLGDAHTAKALLERALVIEEAHYGRDHWQVAITLGNLACACGDLEDDLTKKALLERARVIQEAHYGREHWQVGITLINLASAYFSLEESIQSFVHIEHAYQIFCTHYPDPDYPHTQTAKVLIAQLKKKFPTLNVCTPEVIELLHKRDETGVRQYYRKQRIGFDNEAAHLYLTQVYAQKNQPLGCVLHYQQVLRLALMAKKTGRDLANIYHNLACYNHCYAHQQRASGNESGAKMAFEQSNVHFQQGITLAKYAGIHTEYGQSLFAQGLITEALEQLEQALKITDAAPSSLGYSEMERPNLESSLQKELDFWKELSLPAVFLAHYLLVIAYTKQNNTAAAQASLESFIKLAKDSKEPLVHSLLGHAQRTMGDYASALKSYQQAIALKADYHLAQQQITACQKGLGIVVDTEILTSASMQQATETKGENKGDSKGDSKLGSGFPATFASAISEEKKQTSLKEKADNKAGAVLTDFFAASPSLASTSSSAGNMTAASSGSAGGSSIPAKKV